MRFLLSGVFSYYYFTSPPRVCPPPAGDGVPLQR